jgi:hypothetical protein
MKYPGTLWNILEHDGSLWHNMKYPGTLWNILEHDESLCII